MAVGVDRAIVTALPFVISTGAQRSGEICGAAVLSWKCFSTEESWACGPTQGDEKRLLFSYYCPWKHRPPLVIPTGVSMDLRPT
jgi:hypothetical protein